MGVKFTWGGHATVKVELESGEIIIIDPWIEDNPKSPKDFAEFSRVDLMLLTHGHFDHIGDAISLAKKFEPTIIACFEVCAYLEGKGVKNCSGMNIGGTQEALGCKVTMVPAIHSSGIIDDGKVIYGGVAGGFVVTLPNNYTFYHAGDTALFSDMKLIGELYRPQLAFLPIGDHFTMSPFEASRACKMLGIEKVVPIHWGTFPLLTGTPEELKSHLKDQGIATEVITLEPGETLEV